MPHPCPFSARGSGGSADLRAETVTRLVHPGLRTRGICADGIVAVKPDRHSELHGQRLRAAQLFVREPLQVQVELDLLRMLRRELLRRRPIRHPG